MNENPAWQGQGQNGREKSVTRYLCDRGRLAYPGFTKLHTFAHANTCTHHTKTFSHTHPHTYAREHKKRYVLKRV